MRLSIALADAPAHRFAGETEAGWVSLGIGHDGVLDFHLEDLTQSAVAIQAIEARNRDRGRKARKRRKPPWPGTFLFT